MRATSPNLEIASPSRDELRHAIGHFATGVTVITSRSRTGEPVGTTASAVSSLSLDPPLVLVCLERSSLTRAAIADHGAFAINILSEGQQQLSARFASRGSPAAWDAVAHHHGATGSPRLTGVLAVLECTLEYQLPGGDHEIVVGRVRAVEADGTDRAPLLHYRGSYTSLAEW